MPNDATINPTEQVPGVSLGEMYVPEETTPLKRTTIDSVSNLIMFQSGTATDAPTHSPRNFFEQLVWKDDGSNRVLWVWSQYDKVWRYVEFT